MFSSLVTRGSPTLLGTAVANLWLFPSGSDRNPTDTNGSVAEQSMVLDLGSTLSRGIGSNSSAVMDDSM